MAYTFEPYDVLQVKRGNFGFQSGIWQDFSTLRTPAEAELAVELVNRGSWEGKPTRFRIVQKFPFTIKLEN